MPRIDFDNVDGIGNYSPVPDGQYLCRLTDIEPDSTRSGDEMWKLRWTVESGEHAGRLLFDNLVFSAKALPRVKLVCESCGLDVTGAVDLTPGMLIDKQALVTVYVEEYVDDHNNDKARNRIPFDGYNPAMTNDDNCPF